VPHLAQKRPCTLAPQFGQNIGFPPESGTVSGPNLH
jgi:hypothetical protein